MRNHLFINTSHRCISILTAEGNKAWYSTAIAGLLLLLIVSIMERTITNAIAQDETEEIEQQQKEETVVIDEKEQERQRQIADDAERQREAGSRFVLTIKGVEYPFRWCPAGRFMMGSPINEKGRSENETQRQVTLPRGFWILETEVTQEMWEGIMESNPSHFKGSRKLPVEKVSWNNCQEYIGKLNGLNTAPWGHRFSLPTEIQWEYACRAGTTTPFHFGNMPNSNQVNSDGNFLLSDANAKEVYTKKTAATGSYPANAWGLFDMHGNVWEWCSDRYIEEPSSNDRVLRGGGWSNVPEYCRSAQRNYNDTCFNKKYIQDSMVYVMSGRSFTDMRED
jgi:formylglycine-generating enzyme required for sulfatase activity